MAVIQNGQRDQVRVTYKTSYDTLGEFPQLEDYTQTLSFVKETATLDQKRALAAAFMSLTVYSEAPYKVELIQTSTLVNG